MATATRPAPASWLPCGKPRASPPPPGETICTSAPVRATDGTLHLHLHSGSAWTGVLRFDHPRHQNWLRLPFDYPRINQFPEWFTVEDEGDYTVRMDEGPAQTVSGGTLRSFPLKLKPNQTMRLSVA
jgi:hypothetical protein